MTERPINRRTFATFAAGAAAMGMAGCFHEGGDPGSPEDDDGGDDVSPDDTDPDDTDDTDDTDDDTVDDEDNQTVDDEEDDSVDDEDDDDDEDGDEQIDADAVVGELIEGDSLHIVVEHMETTGEIEGTQAPEGMEMVVTQLAVKNVTNENQDVANFLDASVRDDEDLLYPMGTVGEAEEAAFNQGSLAAGEVTRDRVLFEVQEDSSGRVLQLELDEELFGQEQVDVNLEDSTDAETLEHELTIENEVGDSVETDGVEVGVNDVIVETDLNDYVEEAEDEDEGEEIDEELLQPESGQEFVLVDAAVTNNTGEEVTLSPGSQLTAKDDEGWVYQEDWEVAGVLAEGFNGEAAIEDGDSEEGLIVYELEEDLTPLYWAFEFSPWVENGEKAFWELR